MQSENGQFLNIAWSSDDKYLATWNSNEGVANGTTLDLWNPATWQVVKTYTDVSDFSWSPDGSQMAMIKDGHVQIVATGSENVLKSYPGGSGLIENVAWQPHGTKILISTYNVSANTAHLSLWDTKTNSTYIFTQYQGISGDWSPDGKYVWMAAFNYNPPEGTPKPPQNVYHQIVWIAD